MWSYKPLQLNRSLAAALGATLLTLSQVLTTSGLRAGTATAPTPDNNCLTQAAAQINKVRYVGKNSTGDDEVAVEWLVQSVSECVPFGSGPNVPGKENITPFGYEITVKIKRRLGHEDSGKVTKREIVKGTTTTIVRIPRENLETDPVSFTATLKTTAGAVQTFNRVVTGLGIPSLAGATQSNNKHSTVVGLTSCFSSVDVSAINFIPGAGTTPDNVTINWNANTPASPCFEQPRFSIWSESNAPTEPSIHRKPPSVPVQRQPLCNCRERPVALPVSALYSPRLAATWLKRAIRRVEISDLTKKLTN